MANEQSLEDLLDRWEALNEQGESITPEELCRDCPELLAEFRRRIRELTVIDHFLRGGEEADPEPPADVRAGRYRPVRLLARGGLGEVFVAEDEELSREVALKRLQPCKAWDRDSRRRFLREAEVTGRLEHPGVVPVYGLGRDDGDQPYYAMRLIRGQSFDEAIVGYFNAVRQVPTAAVARKLAFQKLLRNFLSVCQTIDYAHSRGVLHRDLKPSNIMLGDYGETLVVDWGLAKVMTAPPCQTPDGDGANDEPSEVTKLGRVEGSLGYMSPEQGAGLWDQVGPAADIFALGATLYKLLTGRPPYQGSDLIELVAKVKLGDFPPPRQVRPDVPRALEAVCLKAMRIDPAQRYASAGALAYDIERWLADEPVGAWREPLHDRARRWLRRHRTLAIAFVAGLAVAVVVAAAAALTIAHKNTQIDRKNEELEAANCELTNALQANQESLYATAIPLAYREWSGGNLAGARDLLDSCPEERRGWEWRYLDRLTHRELKKFDIPFDEYSVASLTPDGRRLAVIHSGVHVWDLSTGKAIGRLPKAHELDDVASGAALSPDGRLLATSQYTARTLRVWDVETGQPLWEVRTHRLGPVAFSGDGRLLAFATGQLVHLVDARSFKEMLSFRVDWHRDEDLSSLTFDPAGKVLAVVGRDWMVSLWNIEMGTKMGDPVDFAKAVAFRPGGGQFVTTNAAVKVWSLPNMVKVRELHGHTSLISAVAYSHDGRYLATGSWDRIARVWDLETGREVRTIRGHSSPVTAVAFSDDGGQLITVSQDGPKVWDITTDQDARTLEVSRNGDEVVALAFNSDGSRLASLSGKSRPLTIEYGGSATELRIWDPTRSSRALVAAISLPEGHVFQSLVLSPDGTLVAAASAREHLALRTRRDDTDVQVWDSQTGNERFHFTMKVGVSNVLAFSPDGRYLAAAGFHFARVWNLTTGDEAAGADGEFVCTWAAFALSDSRLLVANPYEAQRWDWRTKASFPTVDSIGEQILDNTEINYAFSPDGSRLAFTGYFGAVVHITDLRGGNSRSKVTLRGHSRKVVGLAFSPDGRRLVTASLDQTVKVWDAATGKELLTLRGLSQMPNVIAFSPDGDSVAVGCTSLSPGVACEVKVWRAAPRQ